MKRFISFLILVAIFSGPVATAQKQTIELDARYFKVIGNGVSGATLGYGRALTEQRALFVKVAYNMYKTQNRTVQNWIGNLDVTNRWKLSRKKKANWFGEVGISGLLEIRRTSPYELLLDGGPYTPEELQAFIEDASKHHTKTNFYPGFASAIHWEYALSSKVSLGLNCVLNLYVDSRGDSWLLPLILPSLHSAFSF